MTWLPCAASHNCERHIIGIRAIELGLIAMGAGDSRFEVVGDDDVGHRTEGQSGARGVTGPVAGDGGNSRGSNVAASSPSGRGQDNPATWARCTYAATVGRLRPRLRAICRSLSPTAHLRRNTA